MDFWLPPKPAIIRPAEPRLVKQAVGPGMVGVVGFGRPKITRYRSTGTSTDTLSAYTFNLSFGPAHPRRKLIAAVTALSPSTSQPLLSVTIAGVTADIDITRRNTGNSNNGNASIVSALVPGGTSGDVVATYNGVMVSCAISIYSIIGLDSLSVFHTSPASTGDNQNTMLINTPYRGTVIGCCCKTGPGSASTWSGLDEDYDSGSVHSHAHRAEIVAQSNYEVSVTAGGSPSRYVCASYG